ncbi:MAG TPA: hypothetical protein VKS62_02955 [Methylomirabilota bacterium]|nr:hypothetical protein [Methylomirabilota bacterium]
MRGVGGWRDEYAQQLAILGARQLILSPDHDTPGLKYTATIARATTAAGFEVRALQLPGQGPVLEKVRASLSLYQLLRAAGATMWEAAQLTLAGPAPVVGESGLSCDVKNGVALLPILVPQSISVGAVNGVGQDCVLYSEHGLLVYVGALTGVSTVDAKVQESSVVGSGYGDIPGASIAQIVAANRVAIINFKRSLRFTRAVVTAGGTAALVAAARSGQRPAYKVARDPTAGGGACNE